MPEVLDSCFGDDYPIENINHCPNDEVVAGLSTKLYYIVEPHVATFTNPPKEGTYEEIATIPAAGLVPVTGKGWKKIDVLVNKNQLQNLTVGTRGIKKLKGQIDVFIPGFRAKLVGFQRAHLNSRLIFGIKDSSGQMWIIGNKINPSYFENLTLASGDTDEADAGLTGQIMANTSIFAYNGDMTVLADSTTPETP
ncbi:hypothetical protein [Chryseobacterium terrae]|uniref:Uncharacterized protein n=1 Tax=Chryseobacterium terrae TaxID=3163299 RepID=A0ABW8Y5B9_9FLAO